MRKLTYVSMYDRFRLKPDLGAMNIPYQTAVDLEQIIKMVRAEK